MMQIACVAELSLWTRFLEASVEDMHPTAYLDACTTKFYFREFFLLVPMFASQETFEKILTERMSYVKR
jgi:hypothetical protein